MANTDSPVNLTQESVQREKPHRHREQEGSTQKVCWRSVKQIVSLTINLFIISVKEISQFKAGIFALVYWLALLYWSLWTFILIV